MTRVKERQAHFVMIASSHNINLDNPVVKKRKREGFKKNKNNGIFHRWVTHRLKEFVSQKKRLLQTVLNGLQQEKNQ